MSSLLESSYNASRLSLVAGSRYLWQGNRQSDRTLRRSAGPLTRGTPRSLRPTRLQAQGNRPIEVRSSSSSALRLFAAHFSESSCGKLPCCSYAQIAEHRQKQKVRYARMTVTRLYRKTEKVGRQSIGHRVGEFHSGLPPGLQFSTKGDLLPIHPGSNREFGSSLGKRESGPDLRAHAARRCSARARPCPLSSLSLLRRTARPGKFHQCDVSKRGGGNRSTGSYFHRTTGVCADKSFGRPPNRRALAFECSTGWAISTLPPRCRKGPCKGSTSRALILTVVSARPRAPQRVAALSVSE